MTKRFAIAVLFMLGVVACSSGTDGDQWASLRGELVVQGISSDSSRCVIAELEAADIAAEDLTTAADAPTLAAAQAAYDRASANCFTNDEISAIVESEIEQILPEVATALGITVEQTRCIVDGFESQGLSFADVASGAGNPAVADAMAALMPLCTGSAESGTAPSEPSTGANADQPPVAADEPAASDPATTTDPTTSAPAPGASAYDTPEFRQTMIDGIATGTGQSPEVATCILDSTLAQGLTMDDFVLRGADEDVVAAITSAGELCIGG